MAYTIVRTDGTVLTTIPDGIVNTTSTPLSLPGRNYPGYGQVVDTNTVRALENFADTTPPLNALKGQLWFNTNDDTLYICPIDGETDPNNWYKVISYPLDNLELNDLNANGDITANNAYIDNDVTANHIITDYLTVNVNADIEEATINGVAYIGEANTTRITTGTRPTLGNMIGTWTVNGLGTVNGVSNTSLWVTGGNLVVTGPGTVGIRTNNYMWANGVPVSFDGTYTNTNVMFYLSTFEGNLSFPGSNTAFNGNIISTGSNSNSGTIIGNWTLGPGSKLNGLSDINGANVTGIVPNAQQAQFASTSNVANTVIQNAQPNITSVGTLTGLGVNGTITGVNITANTGIFSGNAAGLYNIPIANLVGTFPTVGNATSASQADVANTVSRAAQPNITSLGTLTGLSVSGGAAFGSTVNLGAVGNVRITGGSSGQVLATNGSGGLSWVSTGAADTADVAITVSGNAQPNITSLGTLSSLSVSGSVSAGAVNASTLQGTLTTGSQPSITSLGTLTSLNVSGSAAFTGPLITLGSVSNIRITGGQPGYVLATDGSGGLSWVSSGSATTAQYVTMGNQSNITSLGTLSGLSVSGVTNLGPASNVRITGGSAGQVLSTDGAGGLSWASAGAAITAQTVTNNAQPNITSVGTLNGLSVTGSTTLSGVTNLGAVSNVRIFGGSAGFVLSTDGQGGLSWTSAGSATTAQYVTQPNQSNITSLGTLSSLRVTGVVDLGSVNNLTISGGADGQVLTTNGSGDVSWSPVTTAQTVTNSSQPNITSLGSLTGLSVSGVTNLGPVGNVRISGGSAGYVLSTNGSGGLSWIPSGTATTAQTVTNNAQPNITSVGTLNSLNVSGIANLGSASNVIITGGAAGSVLTTNGSGGLSWGTAPAATTAQTVTNNAQPNITSVGTLTTLSVSGVTNLGSAGNVRITGGADGYVLSTNGAGGLSWIPSGTATTAQTVTNNAQPNITSVGTLTSLSVSGVSTLGPAGNVRITGGQSGQYLTTNGSGGLSWSYVTTAATVTGNAQPNITSVGTLTSLNVTNDISARDVTISGIFSGSGARLNNIPGANVTGSVPGADYATRAGNSNYANVAGGADYANRAGTASTATSASSATTAQNASFAQTAGSASTAGTVTNAAQANITSLGTLTGLAVNGPLTRNGQTVLTVADFTTGSGWTRLPNGMLIQYGTGTVRSESYGYVYFPVAFNSFAYAVVSGSSQSTSDGRQAGPGVVGTTTSYFSVFSGRYESGPTTISFNWIAVGY